MRWRLHSTVIEGTTRSAEIESCWQALFRSLPVSTDEPDILMNLELKEHLEPPSEAATFSEREVIHYYLYPGHDEPGRSSDPDRIVAYMPKYGQLGISLGERSTQGFIRPSALSTCGVFEDIAALGLSPHLRRLGLFFVHSFAASCGGRCALIVGSQGSGKTTTGLALLTRGWGLISNDAPLLTDDLRILSFPGTISANADSLLWFEQTRRFVVDAGPKERISLRPESIREDLWVAEARPSVLLFPDIGKVSHSLDRLSSREALVKLLPHSVEKWDRAMIPGHFEVLRRLVEKVPAYTLSLSPNVDEDLHDIIFAVAGVSARPQL